MISTTNMSIQIIYGYLNEIAGCWLTGRQSRLCERISLARRTAGYPGTVDHCIPPPFYLTNQSQY